MSLPSSSLSFFGILYNLNVQLLPDSPSRWITLFLSPLSLAFHLRPVFSARVMNSIEPTGMSCTLSSLPVPVFSTVLSAITGTAPQRHKILINKTAKTFFILCLLTESFNCCDYIHIIHLNYINSYVFYQ